MSTRRSPTKIAGNRAGAALVREQQEATSRDEPEPPSPIFRIHRAMPYESSGTRMSSNRLKVAFAISTRYGSLTAAPGMALP